MLATATASRPAPLSSLGSPGHSSACSLTLNLAGNGRVSLWDRDEPRYAGCTREMRASGDWIHPTFNAEPRYHKPILIYWLMLAGTAVGGDNPFGARLVSALAGAGTCLLVWALGPADARPAGGAAGRPGPGDGADHGRRVEAGDDRRDADVLAGRLPVLRSGSCRRRRRGGSAAVFWRARPGDPDQGAGRAGADRRSGVASWWWGGPTACWRRLHWRWGPLLCLAIVPPLVRGDPASVARRSFTAWRSATTSSSRMPRGIEEHGGFPGYYVVLGLVTFFPWSALLPAALWRPGRGDGSAGVRLPARLGDRAADPAGMRPDEADPLLPARVPGLRLAGGLAGGGRRRLGGEPATLAARPAWRWGC